MDNYPLMRPNCSTSQTEQMKTVAHLLGAMADTRADAVSAGVASSNHNHRLVLCSATSRVSHSTHCLQASRCPSLLWQTLGDTTEKKNSWAHCRRTMPAPSGMQDCSETKKVFTPSARLDHLGRDVVAIGEVRVQQGLGVGSEELHGEVDALGLAPRDGQVARLGCARRQHHRVMLRAHILDVHVLAHVRICDEAHTLGGLCMHKKLSADLLASNDVPGHTSSRLYCGHTGDAMPL